MNVGGYGEKSDIVNRKIAATTYDGLALTDPFLVPLTGGHGRHYEKQYAYIIDSPSCERSVTKYLDLNNNNFG